MSSDVPHNNGVYFNPNGNQTLSYKGKTYAHKDGRKVDFSSGDPILDLVEDVINPSEKLIWHPPVANVAYIEHLFNFPDS